MFHNKIKSVGNLLLTTYQKEFPTEEMSHSKLESHLWKLCIPFIRIAHIPGYGQYKVRGPMKTIEADVRKTMNEKNTSNKPSAFLCST